MIDSCSPSKLDPGLAAAYSKPRLLITSTMKSEAGCSTMRALGRRGGGSVSAASCAGGGTDARDAAVSCGSAASGGADFATSPAAPTAAPCRNRRRPTDGCGFITRPRISMNVGARDVRRRGSSRRVRLLAGPSALQLDALKPNGPPEGDWVRLKADWVRLKADST